MVNIGANTPQLKVTQKWIDAYIAIDIGKIDAVTSKNYKHQTSPQSVGLPEETKEEYTRRLVGMFPLFTKFESTIHTVIEAPGKVIIHATDICPTVYGVTLTYEAIYTLSFIEEDGALKVSRCSEFIDSQEHRDFTAKITKLVAEGSPVL